ncbi:MAG: LamG-like jellyroll fold domain-containing protein, partial [Verrucomicrobiota bacterium]
MKLFLNGFLVGTNAVTESFNAISGTRNFIGGWNLAAGGPGVGSFAGQIDEFRVWKVARTEEQVRDNMFRKLTGTEAGLAGLWNFDVVENGLVKDLSPGRHDGKMIGNAKAVAAELPASIQTTANERVLDLDGKESYVELPAQLFTNQVVTVEGWIKWREFGIYSRFFEFGDASLQIALNNYSTSASLQFQRYRAPEFDDHTEVVVADLLRPNEWFHLAAVAGTNFSKLYLNSSLISTNEVVDGWKPSPLPPLKNFLGRSVMKGLPNAAADTELNGQIAEVRLWAGERTPDQIKASMMTDLIGQDPGLLALWNFTDGTARDASTNGRHGKLVGNARVVTAPRRKETALRVPAFISGKLLDEAGQAVTNVSVQLIPELPPGAALPGQGQPAASLSQLSGADGGFSFALFSEATRYELLVTEGENGARRSGLALKP